MLHISNKSCFLFSLLGWLRFQRRELSFTLRVDRTIPRLSRLQSTRWTLDFAYFYWTSIHQATCPFSYSFTSLPVSPSKPSPHASQRTPSTKIQPILSSKNYSSHKVDFFSISFLSMQLESEWSSCQLNSRSAAWMTFSIVVKGTDQEKHGEEAFTNFLEEWGASFRCQELYRWSVDASSSNLRWTRWTHASQQTCSFPTFKGFAPTS